MPSHRPERVAEAIREVVAESVLFELNDPRIRGVTVLRAEVARDLRSAVVYVTVMGSEGERRRALHALQHAAGHLQSRVARRLQTRFTPILRFELDEGVRQSVEMSRLIAEALAEDATRHPPTAPAPNAAPPALPQSDGARGESAAPEEAGGS
jgi:ribosome-binding factor A